MGKRSIKPGAMLAPVPAVLVSCEYEGVRNLITIAWTGIVNSDPPMTYISVMKKRFSHDLIQKSGCFVINLNTEAITRQVDFCGVRSGRDVDKFAACGFTALPADAVSAPLVAESPVNLECRVVEVREYPSHDMFVAEIVGVHVDEELFEEDGRIAMEKAGLTAYANGAYYTLRQRQMGRFGYSVMKPKTKKRLNREANEKRRAQKALAGRKAKR